MMTPYQITEDLYVQAMTHAQKRMRMIVISVCIIVPLFVHVLKGFPQQTLVSVLIVYIILAFYFLVLAPMISRINFQRAYRKNPLLHKTQYYELRNGEILFKSENGESKYKIEEIKRLLILPDLVMIYPSDRIFHLIPKSVLSEKDLAVFQNHIRL